jgi:exonuclease SbcD
MLLVHTADLHLGKTLHERDLQEDQAFMLEGLLELLATRRPAALLIAGDIYDRAIPPPDAISLFDSFLSRAIEAAPGLAIVAIPGNHDSATRLSFGAGLFRRAGVHFRSRAAEALEPVIVAGRGERCAIWALPFLGGGADIGDGLAEVRGQAELFSIAVSRIVPRLEPASFNVLLGHCFASGGASSESERSFVGLAEEVDARLFDPFDYAALGHLHRPQAAGTKGRYPGSPLAYSFGEASVSGADQRGFVLLELAGGVARTELVPFVPKRRLVRLEGSFEELSAPGAYAEHRGDFVEARLTDSDPVLDPVERLRLNFPELLAVRQAAFEILLSDGDELPSSEGAADRGSGDASTLMADFERFHAAMRGGAPDEETLALVAGLAAEAERAAD